jgi:hypothetical protein
VFQSLRLNRPSAGTQCCSRGGGRSLWDSAGGTRDSCLLSAVGAGVTPPGAEEQPVLLGLMSPEWEAVTHFW